MIKKVKKSKRESGKSKIEKFVEKDIVIIPQGLKSHEGNVFDKEVYGEIRIINNRNAIVQLERKYDHGFVTYDIASLKKHKNPREYRKINS